MFGAGFCQTGTKGMIHQFLCFVGRLLFRTGHNGKEAYGRWRLLVEEVGEAEMKSRDITLPTKVRLVKAMVFPVVMYGCESWTVKKAKH